MRTTTLALAASLGAVMAGAPAAEPAPVTIEEAHEAAELIVDLAYSMSEPFYDGSYFVVSIRPDETCTVTKRLEDYSADEELTKVTLTTYDASLIDPATIKADGFGGINFWARGEAPVFHQEVIEGGDYSNDIPGDIVTVSDPDNIDPLVSALKTFAAWGAQEKAG